MLLVETVLIVSVGVALFAGAIWGTFRLVFFLGSLKRRRSSAPVSAFFLVQCPEDGDVLLAKTALLQEYGVDPKRVEEILCALRERMTDKPLSEEEVSMKFTFDLARGPLPGWLNLRLAAGDKLEAELVIPALIAYRAKKLFKRGYWTAYMSPAFYD